MSDNLPNHLKSRKKVLFVGEHLTPSHTVRPLLLAQHLKTLDANYDIELALPSVPAWCNNENIQIHKLPSPDAKILGKRVEDVFFPLYKENEISEMVKAEITLLESLKPDLVIADFRNTLAISTRVTKSPLIFLSDFYWHKEYLDKPMIVPDTKLSHLIGYKLARSLGRPLTPLIEKWHVSQFNLVARKYGLNTFANLREIYNSGDEKWLLDIPKVWPDLDLAKSKTKFVGPMTWDVDIETAERIHQLADKSAICITLASSGTDKKVIEILRVAKEFGLPLIVLTADKFTLPEVPNIYVEKFLPLSVALAKSKVFIGTGGSSVVYPAIKAGVPVIGIPQNITHWYSMRRFAVMGIGKLVLPEEVSSGSLETSLLEILSSGSFADKIADCQQNLNEYDIYSRINDSIKEYLS
jgi:UDP:flavonoid glycosyltransferase YjiC (YdhE family)